MAVGPGPTFRVDRSAEPELARVDAPLQRRDPKRDTEDRHDDQQFDQDRPLVPSCCYSRLGQHEV